MNETDILTRWNDEKLLYLKWGQFVDSVIKQQIAEKCINASVDTYLKVAASPRLKSDESLVDKAMFRGKTYEHPYDDITDKVGVRYVVLLTSQIKEICSIIESEECERYWSHSKDRDYENERRSRPLEFTYQSVHYVLRSKEHSGAPVGDIFPANLPCEVQIRTLLQHAHSELTHDTIYKPKTAAIPTVVRTVAKTMALIEATDEYFLQATNDLACASEPQRRLLDLLSNQYKSGTGFVPGTARANAIIVDSFIEALPDDFTDAFVTFLTSKPYIFARIAQRIDSRFLFKQPAILLVYYLADRLPAQTRERWPLQDVDLETVFSDLGVAF